MFCGSCDSRERLEALQRRPVALEGVVPASKSVAAAFGGSGNSSCSMRERRTNAVVPETSVAAYRSAVSR